MAGKNHDIQVFLMPGENTFHFNQTNVCLRLKHYESMINDQSRFTQYDLHLIKSFRDTSYFKQYIPLMQIYNHKELLDYVTL